MTNDTGRAVRENQVRQLVREAHGASFDELLDRVAAALKEQFAHYTGVYMYLLRGDVLVLGAYRGRPTEHTRIPVGAGVCGRAARVKETVTVDDVNADPEYLACSLETRSELVVPILQGERVLGEIDIDSDIPSAFTERDRQFLEELARLLAGHADAEGRRQSAGHN